jgi:carboxypeptidase Taq
MIAAAVLQDVHWSGATMGIPDVHAREPVLRPIFEKAKFDIPDLRHQFEKGQFGALKKWLNTNIHAHGRRYRAHERVRR